MSSWGMEVLHRPLAGLAAISCIMVVRKPPTAAAAQRPRGQSQTPPTAAALTGQRLDKAGDAAVLALAARLLLVQVVKLGPASSGD